MIASAVLSFILIAPSASLAQLDHSEPPWVIVEPDELLPPSEDPENSEDLEGPEEVAELATSPPEQQAGVAWKSPGALSTADGDRLRSASKDSPLWLNLFSILYGPSVRNPSSFQPAPDGTLDKSRPLFFRNQLSLGYDVTERFIIGGTLPFVWIPVHGQKLDPWDPYLRVGLDRIFRTDHLNYYADLRIHFPITRDSREQDMLAAFQTFQLVTLRPGPASAWSLDLYGSARANFFGRQGSGTDLELYFAPQMNYQASPTVAFTLLYEMGASHWFGDKPWLFYSDGTHLEPGISWDVTPNFNLHPYMNIFPSGKVSWASTSVGLMLNWKLL